MLLQKETPVLMFQHRKTTPVKLLMPPRRVNQKYQRKKKILRRSWWRKPMRMHNLWNKPLMVPQLLSPKSITNITRRPLTIKITRKRSITERRRSIIIRRRIWQRPTRKLRKRRQKKWRSRSQLMSMKLKRKFRMKSQRHKSNKRTRRFNKKRTPLKALTRSFNSWITKMAMILSTVSSRRETKVFLNQTLSRASWTERFETLKAFSGTRTQI